MQIESLKTAMVATKTTISSTNQKLLFSMNAYINEQISKSALLSSNTDYCGISLGGESIISVNIYTLDLLELYLKGKNIHVFKVVSARCHHFRGGLSSL